MLFLAFWALRNLAIAPLIGLPVVARAFARDRGASRRHAPHDRRRRARADRRSSGWSSACARRSSTRLRVRDLPGEVDALRRGATGCSARRLLTSDSDAGYVILEYYPEQRVFIDDRYDMYPTKLIYDYFTIADGKPGWSKILDRYHVETVVWDTASALAAELDASPNWHRVHRDQTRRCGSGADGRVAQASGVAARGNAEQQVETTGDHQAERGAADHVERIVRADVHTREHHETHEHPRDDLPSTRQIGRDQSPASAATSTAWPGHEARSVPAHVTAELDVGTDRGARSLPGDDVLDQPFQQELRDRREQDRGGEAKAAQESRPRAPRSGPTTSTPSC